MDIDQPRLLVGNSIAGALLRGHLIAVAEIELLIEATGLTTLEAYVLRIVAGNPTTTIVHLRLNTALAPSTLSGILKRLEDRHLVRRTRHAGDRRVVIVRPTRAARTVVDIIDAAFREFDARIHSVVPQGDIGDFAALIESLEIRRRSTRWWG